MRAVGIILAGGNNNKMRSYTEACSGSDADRRKLPGN